MINCEKICQLIYKQKNQEAYKIALDYLNEPQEGIQEILRLLYLKDIYFRLKDKKNVIIYGKLEIEAFLNYSKGRKLLNDKLLKNQCNIIEQKLLTYGKSDIIIEAFVDEKETKIFIFLEQNNGQKIQGIVTKKFEQEVIYLLMKKNREEAYILLRMIVREIDSKIKECIEKNMYDEVKISVSRST